VSLWQSIKVLFGSPRSADPTEAWQVDASSEDRLSEAVERLPAGVSGWITSAEARALFSTADREYAFGEMDEDGNRNIASFAARHHSDVSFMPVENRVYFLRNRS
jgi:hypothetical protein